MIFKYLLITLFCFMICHSTQSQQVDPVAIQKELEELGVDQEEVKRRLIAEGYDPDRIDINNPNAFAEIQAATERIVRDIQAENALKKNEAVKDSVTSLKPKEVIELPVKDTVNDVAVSEITKLPKSVIYGQHLYRNGAIKFYKKSEYIKPTQNYILGPGDKVTIAIWGNAELNENQEISSDGFVKFHRMARVYLNGLTLKSAKSLLEAKFARNYPFQPGDFEVTVSATRNVNVFISGEVINVGSYNISALNSAINALAAAGGPTDIGSVRNIKLVRSDGSSSAIDLYKLLDDPSIMNNFFLEDENFIVIPLAGKVVEIRGAVNKAYKFELLQNENLADLIRYAGGLKVDALRKNVSITRYENDQVVILNTDVSTLSKTGGFELKDGDLVQVSSINENVKNAVIVEGAIENGGSFAYQPNMRLSDLMSKTILKEDALLDVGYLVRLNDDLVTVKYEIVNIQQSIANPGSDADILLQVNDKLIIRAKSEFARKNSFVVQGAVRQEGEYNLDDASNLRVSDAIYLSGGLKEEATDFAYIVRKPPGKLSPTYISINVREAILNPASAENINLSPGDILNVYNQGTFFDEAFVSIAGAVRTPQEFEYDPSLTLKDAIIQAGGLTIQAAANKIDIFRIEFQNNNKTRILVANAAVDQDLNLISGGNFQLQPFDQIVVRTAPEFELQRVVYIEGEVKYPGKFYLVDDNSTLLDVLNGAGGLTEEAFAGGATLLRAMDETGYIIIDLVKAMQKPNSTVNVILQEGDRIFIPKRNNLVTVTGAINTALAFNQEVARFNKANYVFEKGKGVQDYIKKSGGFSDRADKSAITVTYPNGEKHKMSKFLFFKNYPEVVPGSIITVGYKIVKERSTDDGQSEIDWGNVLANSIAQATAILSLILLIQNVD